MRTIPLTQGKVALVDDADYNWLNNRGWCANPDRYTFYATRKIAVAKYKQRTERMHRLILGLLPSDGRQCDHRDGNGLNNQRSNLRVCSSQQNSQSQRKRAGTSKYKGVSWNRRARKWYSQIVVNRNLIHLGRFDSEADAAAAYDSAASKHFGQFALTNEMMSLL